MSNSVVPSGWTRRRFKDVCSVTNGQVDPKVKPYSEMPHIGPGNIEKMTGQLLDYRTAMEDNQTSGKYLFDETNVLYGKINPQFGKVVFPRFSGVCSADVYPISCDSRYIVPEFLKYLLLGDDFFKYAVSLSGRTGIPKINRSDLDIYEMLLPVIPEQRKISAILTSVDEAIDATQRIIDQTEVVKRGLMQQLLTKGIGHTTFKQTEIGEIPDSWNVNLFENIVDILIDFRGRTPKKLGMDWGGGNISALSANNVKMGYIDFNAECYLGSEELYNKWMTKGDLRQGDILFTMEAPLGNVAQVPDNERYILSQRVIAVRPKKFLEKDFLKYYMMSPFFQELLLRNSTGTTAKGISQKNLFPLPVLVPTIEEQRKIADVLLLIDNKLSIERDTLEQYKSIKNGLMQVLLTGKIRVNVDEPSEVSV